MFSVEPDLRPGIFWRYVDTLREVSEIPVPNGAVGRTPPSGRDWHKLLETIFNRHSSAYVLTDRVHKIWKDIRQDFPGLSSYYGVTSPTSSRWNDVAVDAVEVLARWMVGESPMPLRADTDPVAGVPDASQASVVVCTSAIHYSRLIVALEHGASRIDRIPKRLSVLFKSEAAVEEIAEQRFGPGSSQVDAYVQEHRERKSQFFEQLDNGLRCREIYSKKELQAYLRSGTHGQTVKLERTHLLANVKSWLDCLTNYSGYLVALTDETVPFKYQVVNGTTVILHEAVSGNDRDRLNAMCITSVPAGREFLADFDRIWDRTDSEFRKAENIVKWVHQLISETS